MKADDFLNESEQLDEWLPAATAAAEYLGIGAVAGQAGRWAITKGIQQMLKNPKTRQKAKDALTKFGLDSMDFDDKTYQYDPQAGTKAAEWYRKGRIVDK